MLPLIKFTININEPSVYEPFSKAMKDFYSLAGQHITRGEDLFFIDKLLYNWVTVMVDRRRTCEGVLVDGNWDECYFDTKYAGFEVKAMIVFTS